MKNILEFLKATYTETNIRPTLVCSDGFNMSVQASYFHYCYPRQTLSDSNYNEVEVGFPNMEEPLIMEYAENPEIPTETVYGWVPIAVIDEVIVKHGGISGYIDEHGLTVLDLETK